MTKYNKVSAATYVSHPMIDGDDVKTFGKLVSLASDKLGGYEGMALQHCARSGDILGATFIRVWDEPVPEPENDSEDDEAS